MAMHAGTSALIRSRTPKAAVLVGQDQPWWDQPVVEFIGPDTAKQRVNEVDGMFAVLDLDIARSPTVSSRFRELWGQHYHSWKDFKKSVDDMSYAALFLQSLSVNERAGHWARGLKDWRDAFGREGGQPVSAAPREERPPEKGVSWSTVAVIVALALGVAAIGYAARGVSTLPRPEIEE